MEKIEEILSVIIEKYSPKNLENVSQYIKSCGITKRDEIPKWVIDFFESIINEKRFSQPEHFEKASIDESKYYTLIMSLGDIVEVEMVFDGYSMIELFFRDGLYACIDMMENTYLIDKSESFNN